MHAARAAGREKSWFAWQPSQRCCGGCAVVANQLVTTEWQVEHTCGVCGRGGPCGVWHERQFWCGGGPLAIRSRIAWWQCVQVAAVGRTGSCGWWHDVQIRCGAGGALRARWVCVTWQTAHADEFGRGPCGS